MGSQQVFLLLLAVSAGSLAKRSEDIYQYDFHMPGVHPQHEDTYLCHAVRTGETPTYLVGFNPSANASRAHHILMYGCGEPGSRSDGVWNCGEMARGGAGGKQAGVCAPGYEQIIYAWGMDADALQLPKDVAFKVGGDTDVKYLVLQVHYKDVSDFVPPAHQKDTSGITLDISETPRPKRAGVILMGTGGELPMGQTTYTEAACRYIDDVTLHPFAFRTHGHTIAAVTSGYRVREGRWTELGRKSPCQPQMFYDTTAPGALVQKGDILAARCTFKNDQDHDIAMGSTQYDEMCNFYLMYYVDGSKLPDFSTCWAADSPVPSWRDFRGGNLHLENVPPTASQDPDTGVNYLHVAKATAKNSGLTKLLNSLLLRGIPL